MLQVDPASVGGGGCGPGMLAVPGLLALLRGLGARRHLPSQGSAIPGSLPRAGICMTLMRSLLPMCSGKRGKSWVGARLCREGCRSTMTMPQGGFGSWLPRLNSSPLPWPPAQACTHPDVQGAGPDSGQPSTFHVSPCWGYPVTFLLGVLALIRPWVGIPQGQSGPDL